MRSRLAALILLTLPLLASCATRSEVALVRAEARIAELEKHLAGAHDDMGMLMAENIALQSEIRAWQYGAEAQARALARMRDGNCDI